MHKNHEMHVNKIQAIYKTAERWIEAKQTSSSRVDTESDNEYLLPVKKLDVPPDVAVGIVSEEKRG